MQASHGKQRAMSMQSRCVKADFYLANGAFYMDNDIIKQRCKIIEENVFKHMKAHQEQDSGILYKELHKRAIDMCRHFKPQPELVKQVIDGMVQSKSLEKKGHRLFYIYKRPPPDFDASCFNTGNLIKQIRDVWQSQPSEDQGIAAKPFDLLEEKSNFFCEKDISEQMSNKLDSAERPPHFIEV
jgi:hypothetical protein